MLYREVGRKVTPGGIELKNCQTIEKMVQMSSENRGKASKVVARSFYKMLRKNGFSQGEIMTFAGHLLDEVIRDMKHNGRKPGTMSGLGTAMREKEASPGSRNL